MGPRRTSISGALELACAQPQVLSSNLVDLVEELGSTVIHCKTVKLDSILEK